MYNIYEKYKDEIVNGFVTDIKVSNTNDLIIEFDNGVKIEVFIANGYRKTVSISKIKNKIA